MSTGVTLVTASYIKDATLRLVKSATMTFQPVAMNGAPVTVLSGDSASGPVVVTPVQGQVVNGVLYSTASLTGSLTSGSPTLTLAAAASIEVGAAISGPGIAANTTVISGSGTSWTLSTNATANVSGGTCSVAVLGITLADMNASTPADFGYAVTLTDNASGCELLGPGYGYVQWPAGATYDFDTYVPVLTEPLAIIQRGPTGPPVTFAGAYASGTTYALGVAVSYNGSSYVSLQAGNTGHEPDTSPTWWGLLAAAGAAGTAGAPGAPGAAGAQGPPVTFAGAYASGTTYALGVAVSYNGSSYVSLQAGNTGHEPDTSPTWWGLLAAAGSPGSISGAIASLTFTDTATGSSVTVQVTNGVLTTVGP